MSLLSSNYMAKLSMKGKGRSRGEKIKEARKRELAVAENERKIVRELC